MRFGIFLAPFHMTGQHPTLALERDLQLLELLETLGFDEAWIGEHHSGGVEIIASPEVFIATAAARTERLRLGTGVSSLPYHHPLMLADRMVLLDHLTRGRAMLGCGPGQLASDAHMLGIEPPTQRTRMNEALAAIIHLLRSDEPLTMATEWFTLRDARLQLRSFSDPHLEVLAAASISPTGSKAAGTHGIGLMSIAATARQGFDALGTHWNVWDETARAHGNVADRNSWRLVGPMHLAETVDEAIEDVRFGIEAFSEYFRHVLPNAPVSGDTFDELVASARGDGFALIGTPDDAVARISELVDESGGFGSYLLFAHNWADWAATTRSYELFAREVMPHFQDQLGRPQASYDWLAGAEGRFVEAATQAIIAAVEQHQA